MAPPKRRVRRRSTPRRAATTPTGRAATGTRVSPAAERPHPVKQPLTRSLRVYAFDPSAGQHHGNEMTVDVPWERLQPGPTGHYVAVVDYDGANECWYEPVDLEDPHLIAQDGLDPSESDPRFHQQMVYAIVMDTVNRFERALGRHIHWRRKAELEPWPEDEHIFTLRLLPHAMEDRNAYYSPEAKGILFGYFRADRANPGRNLPGQLVFTCLSHDIVVHEATHAIIDGLRKYFTVATNADVPAFHEGFADIVSIFRHFSHREILLDAIRRTGGRLFDASLATDERLRDQPSQGSAGAPPPILTAQVKASNPLIDLARQFGDSTGRSASLRSALGVPADPASYASVMEPHERGSILVAAIFDAYFSIYLRRTAPLLEVLRAGGGGARTDHVPLSLAQLLATEASRTANEFFRICVRALDYCPPCDITFGDFLRSLLTAHHDLTPDDPDGIREAFMEAFRARGVWPGSATSFTENALRWEEPEPGSLPAIDGLVLPEDYGANKNDVNDRRGDLLRKYALDNAAALGLDARLEIDAASFHRVSRIGADGLVRTDMVIEFVQRRDAKLGTSIAGFGTFPLLGGATLIVELPENGRTQDGSKPFRVRYCISKSLSDPEERRESEQRQFHLSRGLAGAADPARAFNVNFALLHGGD